MYIFTTSGNRVWASLGRILRTALFQLKEPCLNQWCVKQFNWVSDKRKFLLENTIHLPFKSHHQSCRKIPLTHLDVSFSVFLYKIPCLYQKNNTLLFFRGQGSNLSCSNAKLFDTTIWKSACPLIITQTQTEHLWPNFQDCSNCKHLSIKVSKLQIWSTFVWHIGGLWMIMNRVSLISLVSLATSLHM